MQIPVTWGVGPKDIPKFMEEQVLHPINDCASFEFGGPFNNSKDLASDWQRNRMEWSPIDIN